MNCPPLQILIYEAYVRFADGKFHITHQLPIEGLPDWSRTERYAINAKAEGEPQQEMMRGPMMRTILEDRFKLKLRRETREGPVYELTAAKGGVKLQPAKGDCRPIGLGNMPGPPAPGKPMERACGIIMGTSEGMNIFGVTLAEFSRQLSGLVQREVIDKTGSEGKFDIQVEGTMRELFGLQSGPPGATSDSADENAGPRIFSELKRQTGLQLNSAKGPVQVLIVDHIERPAEN